MQHVDFGKLKSQFSVFCSMRPCTEGFENIAVYEKYQVAFLCVCAGQAVSTVTGKLLVCVST